MRYMLRTRSGFKNIFKKIFRRPRGGPTALDVTPLEPKQPLKTQPPQHATPQTSASLHDPLASLHDPLASLHDPLASLHDPLASLHDPSASLHDPSASLHDPSASHPLPDQECSTHSDALEAGQYEPTGH